MTCAEFESRLSAYMDGELSRWKRWKVQTHLKQCAECRSLLEDLETVDQCLHCAVEAQPAPEYITAAVMHRIPAMPPAWRRRMGVMPWAAGLAVAGVQAAALCGAYWWGFNRGTVTSTGIDRTGVLPVSQSSPFLRVRSVTAPPPTANVTRETPATASFEPGRLWSGHLGDLGSDSYQPDPETINRLRGEASGKQRPVVTAPLHRLQWKGAH